MVDNKSDVSVCSVYEQTCETKVSCLVVQIHVHTSKGYVQYGRECLTVILSLVGLDLYQVY